MILQTIIGISKKCGWNVTARTADDNQTTFEFRRKTRHGVPFCFCADMTADNPASLVDEILSFIDAFQPDTFARKWCELSGVGKNLQARTAADFDDMRAEAWLLAAELSDAISSPNGNTRPWYFWN